MKSVIAYKSRAVEKGLTKCSIIELVIVNEEEDELRPQVRVGTSTDHSGDLQTRPEETEMLHHALRVVLGESFAQGGEHS
jgi:hypothetical protein